MMKDTNSKDLTEVEQIKKSSQEYRQKLYKKVLILWITMTMCHSPRARYPGVWSQLGLRKQYYEQASGGDGIPVELLKILKEYAVNVLHSICQQIWKTQHWLGIGKVSFYSNPKDGQCQRMFQLLYSCVHFTC